MTTSLSFTIKHGASNTASGSSPTKRAMGGSKKRAVIEDIEMDVEDVENDL
jgi:hypothetical protein